MLYGRNNRARQSHDGASNKKEWDNDVETIIHVVVLDSVHHEIWALLCMTESRQKVNTLQAIATLKPKFAFTTSIPYSVHSGLRSIKPILKFVHLRAKNKTILGL